jgi:hypothetical protein
LTQVIKKRRIVLASVLKPVDDTRMFEKIGVTLAGGEEEVTIIGYPSVTVPKHPHINFDSLPIFNRVSWKRLFIPWIVFKKINQIKPELIIINTPELLFVAILNRIFFGRKVVYDVLENYFRNIRHTTVYPSLLRLPLAVVVRMIELITSPFIHRFMLAEKGYRTELAFAKPYTFLENKLPKSVASGFTRQRTNGYSKLIFTGTLATTTGVFEAINLCQKLNQLDSSFTLTIIGYCPVPKMLVQIKNEIKGCPYITLIGGEQLVPHSEILDEISRADFGIIIYPPNPSTQSSIPTKLYEYIALKLPVLIRHNAESHQLVTECKDGIILEEAPHYPTLSAALKASNFTPSPPDSVFWESQAENILNGLN